MLCNKPITGIRTCWWSLFLITTVIFCDAVPANANENDQNAKQPSDQSVTTNATTTEMPVLTSPSDQQIETLNATAAQPVELIADAGNETDPKQGQAANATRGDQNGLLNNITTEQVAQASPNDQNATLNTIAEPVQLTKVDNVNGNDQLQHAQAVNATQSDQTAVSNTNIATTEPPVQTPPSDQNATTNATAESTVQLIGDMGNATDQQRSDQAESSGPQPAVAGGELVGGREGDVPLLSGALADEQNAKNESNSNSSDVSSGKVVDTTKFIPHEETDCWTDQNGDDTPRWIANGEQVERGIVWYECQSGKLVTLGCTDENGKRLEVNGTYQSGRYRMQCVQFGENARRQVIGCVPDGQLDKTYFPGETWVDKEKQIWWQCVLENAWIGGCVDDASGNRLNVGDAIDRNLTTYECQYKHLDGFRMVPVGCIFDGTRYSVGLYWQDDEFVFYCKLQKDDAGADASSTTCIDCFLRNQRLFDEEHVFQKEHGVKCAQRLAPDGYNHCDR